MSADSSGEGPMPAGTDLGRLDPALSCARPGEWITADGHFRVVRSGRRWVIRGTSTKAIAVVQAAEGYRERPTFTAAQEHLIGSIYAEPHGWAHHCDEAYALDREAAYARGSD